MFQVRIGFQTIQYPLAPKFIVYRMLNIIIHNPNKDNEKQN